MFNISEDDYQHTQRVWKEFRIHNLGEYHDLYLCTNVILLANVFEAFRDPCLEHRSLDQAHFYTSPGLPWKACLKKTGVRLELLTDPDMLLMFKRKHKQFINMLKLTTSTWVRSSTQAKSSATFST